MNFKAAGALCLLLLFLQQGGGAEPARPLPGPPGLREEFEERLKAVDAADAAGLYDLSLWCRTKKLKKERRRVLEMALRADPGHEKANRELGRVRYKGKWMTPEERDVLVAARRARTMEAMGLVFHEGSWVTKEEKAALEKGLIKYKGRWIAPGQVKQADGMVQVGGEWVKKEDSAILNRMQAFTACSGVQTSTLFTRHFCLFTEFGDSYNRDLAGRLEKGLAWFAAAFGSRPGLALFGGRKLVVCVFDERDAFDRFVTFFSGFEENITDDWTRSARLVLGFAWWDPDCFSVTYRGTRGKEEMTAQVVHQVGHILINRNGYNYHFLPPWLDEGFAILFEEAALGCNKAFCIQGRNLVSSLNQGDLYSGSGWRGLIEELVFRDFDPSFADLMAREMDLMDQDDAAKAAGVLEFLAGNGVSSMSAFLKVVQQGLPRQPDLSWGDPPVLQVQLDALEAGFATVPEDVDAAFRIALKKKKATGEQQENEEGKEDRSRDR